MCIRDRIAERLKGAEGVFIDGTALTREIMESCSDLKYIGIAATGYNHVDLDAAKELGIAVTNVSGYAADAVAQHAIALLLYITNKIQIYSDAVADGEWNRAEDYTFIKAPLTLLAGKSIGIVGYGAIGKRVAEIAEALGMTVNIYSRDREAAIASDVLSLNCPLTKENAGMIDAGFISVSYTHLDVYKRQHLRHVRRRFQRFRRRRQIRRPQERSEKGQRPAEISDDRFRRGCIRHEEADPHQQVREVQDM